MCNQIKLLCVMFGVLGLLGCQGVGIDKDKNNCLLGSECWQQLPLQQQADKRKAWLSERQHLLGQEQQMRFPALWAVRN